MHLKCNSTLIIHKELYICASCKAQLQLCSEGSDNAIENSIGLLQYFIWVFGMLEYPGYLNTWLFFWTGAKLITIPDVVCAAVFSQEKENPTGAKTLKVHQKIRELALVFAII